MSEKCRLNDNTAIQEQSNLGLHYLLRHSWANIFGKVVQLLQIILEHVLAY